MCDQVRAQLTGAAEPPLTPPPPPAIALGHVTSAGDGMHTPGLHGRQIEASGPVSLADFTGESADEGTAAGNAAASSADDGSAGEAQRRGDRDGLPGCCDCELRRATQDMNFENDPCAVQVWCLGICRERTFCCHRFFWMIVSNMLESEKCNFAVSATVILRKGFAPPLPSLPAGFAPPHV